MNDDRIQKILDENGELPDSQSNDIEAYQKLFNYLDKTDTFKPSPGFAHRVTASLDSKKSTSRSASLIVPILIGGLLLSLVLVGLIVYLHISVSLSGFTPTLLGMTLLTLVITGVYKLIEQKTFTTR